MAEEGAPEGTVVVAREQTAGKGRHGRIRSSPPGSGLYLSVVLRPDLPFDQLWQTAFIASVAAAEAILEVSGLPARIKWPNDVLINGRKVCGILIEARKQPAAIVGIGINVNNTEFPPDIAQKATSIAIELGHPIALEAVEKSLLSRLEERLADSFPSVFDAWKALNCTVGRHVVVNTADSVIEGTAVEVDQTGDLIVEHEGIKTRITAGEVILPDA
jgi:BirA family biotin operon repressor/biotin-[acetyl-CoA-carboxylase] ligase